MRGVEVLPGSQSPALRGFAGFDSRPARYPIRGRLEKKLEKKKEKTVKKLNGLRLVGGFAPKELKVEFLREAGVETPEKIWEGRRLWWGEVEGEVEGERELDLATCQVAINLPVGRETWLRFASWIPWFQENEIPLELPLKDLSELLSDPDWEIRVSATQNLSAQARSLPERELLCSILQDEDWRVKGTAAEGLARHAGDPAVQRGLLAFLTDKSRLAERLAECPDEEEEIVDEEKWLRWQAAKALSGHCLVADVREALEVAVRGEDEALRWQAAKALAIPTDDARSQEGILRELGKRDALAELSLLAEDSASRELLIEAMSDHGLAFEAREAAAKSLAAQCNDPEVQRSLIELLTDPDWKMSGVAGGVFGAHPLDPEVQKKIASFLFLDCATRIAVARALGGGPLDPEVQQALLGLLEDENSQVRLAAVTSLARRTADPAVQRGIAPLLKDPHLRAAAAKVLSGHPLDPEVQRSLIELLTDPDRLVRAAAAKALSGHPLAPAP